jgi:UDP-glucose 4-epimerase
VSNVLVTGGAGFIGYHLVQRLLDQGERVHVVDNFARGVEDPALEVMRGRAGLTLSRIDCRDAAAIRALGVDFDVIVHLAAIVGVVHVTQQPYRVLVDNVTLLSNLIDYAKQQKHLKRLMFASTSEVYAGTLEHFDLTIPTPEDTPLALPDLKRPRTSYMLSKIFGEALCLHSGLPVTLFRPHNVYGPRMGSAHVIPELLKRAYDANDGDVLAVASVDQTRSFCYVDDAVAMLVKMIASADCAGETLNLGTQDPEVRIGEVAKICIETVGRDLRIEPRPPPAGSPRRRAPDMLRTIALTGHASQVSLREGIRRTYDWYRRNVFEGSGITAH